VTSYGGSLKRPGHVARRLRRLLVALMLVYWRDTPQTLRQGALPPVPLLSGLSSILLGGLPNPHIVHAPHLANLAFELQHGQGTAHGGDGQAAGASHLIYVYRLC
jgi:hypothetical protein